MDELSEQPSPDAEPEADGAAPLTPEEVHLNQLRIRQATTLRRSLYRTRTYLIVGVIACLVISIQICINGYRDLTTPIGGEKKVVVEDLSGSRARIAGGILGAPVGVELEVRNTSLVPAAPMSARSRQYERWARLAFVLAGFILAVKLAFRAIAVQKEINENLEAREAEERIVDSHVPDFSTLSDGQQHVRNLQRLVEEPAPGDADSDAENQ